MFNNFKFKDKTFCNFVNYCKNMNIVLRIVLVICGGFVAYGYYLNAETASSGEKFIGIGVIMFAFVLMPLFIYHRYKDKNMANYSFKDFAKKIEEEKKED